MKNIFVILKRLLKVVYISLILLGLVVTWKTWESFREPSPFTDYSYKVVCNNGKTFDPTSKPIKYKYYIGEPLRFDEGNIKAECLYGCAWCIGGLPGEKNYQLYSELRTTKADQIRTTMIVFFLYYLLLKIFRRTLLYIFLGKRFLVLK